jgi:hypothetical protein
VPREGRGAVVLDALITPRASEPEG